LAKQCSFCEFASDDVGAFGEHMRDVHQWDRLAAARPAGTLFGWAGAILSLAALALVVWNLEQSCVRSGSDTYCGNVWIAFFAFAIPVVPIGFVCGLALGRRLTKRKAG
jgi:hypothetical protein